MKEYLCWVGGHYRPATFLAEARISGVSRRVSLNMAGALRYNDLVHCGFWESRNSVPPPGHQRSAGHIVGSFRIERITLPAAIAAAVTAELDRQGKVKAVSDGPQTTYRECGSMTIGSAIIVDADLDEIMTIAKQAVKQLGDGAGDKLQVFVGGPLVREYTPPMAVPEGVPFTRSFMHYSLNERGGAGGGNGAAEIDTEILSLLDYNKRTRKERLDMTMPLGLETAMAA